MNKYFSRSEFACACGCDQDVVDFELLEVLMRLRDYFGNPVHINSGNRCENYNKKIGGHENSFHIASKASDIEVEDVEPRVVYDTLDRWYPDKYGLGRYDKFTHIDVRSYKARWKK